MFSVLDNLLKVRASATVRNIQDEVCSPIQGRVVLGSYSDFRSVLVKLVQQHLTADKDVSVYKTFGSFA